MNEPLNLEQAAAQLISYLYPRSEIYSRGAWIGTAWINGMVLQQLTDKLRNAYDQKTTNQRSH